MAMALFSGEFFSDFSALLFLQVAHLSIYINRMLVVYSLLLACNYYQSEKKQLLWFVFYQLRLYVVGAVYVLNEAYIFLNYFPICVLFCSVWVPQIITNTYYGFKKGPSLIYALATSVHCAGIPLYFKATSKNFMLLKPDYLFTFSMIFWISLQIICLKI